MARYGQAAAVSTAAGSHEPTAAIISPAASECRTTCRCDRARSDRNASAVANRTTATDESASTHSGAVAYSPASAGHSANVAAANVAHPAYAPVAALGKGGIREEGRSHQDCETCDQQLLHSQLHLTEHARAKFITSGRHIRSGMTWIKRLA